MILLSAIVKTFEAAFLLQYQHLILPSHRKALSAMKACRTSASQQMLMRCPECDSQLYVPHSCGQRHCPHCQHHESQQWLERQLQKQVPAAYFLLTFTLPDELCSVAWFNQRLLYALMIQCVKALAKVFRAKNTRHYPAGGACTASTSAHLFQAMKHDDQLGFAAA